MTEKYTLTEEHKAQLEPWSQKWIANALNTELMTSDEKASVEVAIGGLYRAADLAEPRYIGYALSPITAQVISGVAAALCYIENDYTEAQRSNAAREACEIAVRRGFKRIELLDRSSQERDESASLNDLVAFCYEESLKAASFKGRRGTGKADTKLVNFMTDCVSKAFRMRSGGNQWSGWVAFLSFFRHVVKLELDYSKWQHYEAAAIAGPRYMHQRFCIYSDRPAKLSVENRVPHAADGPSHVWRDGWQLYYWRGRAVPKAWIVDKDNLDPAIALTHPNVEMRRTAAEIIGWGKVIEKLKPRIIDTNKDPMIGELLEVDLPDSPGTRFLKVLCGTGRTFHLGVPREVNTALEANAWTYNLKPSELKLEIRT